MASEGQTRPVATSVDGRHYLYDVAVDRLDVRVGAYVVTGYDAREGRLARFDIPFWFLRLKESPIRFGTYATGLDELKISLTAAEIERYGLGIIMDIEREGRDRALLWVE